MDGTVRAWVVDQGNTRLKLGVFVGGELTQVLHDEAALGWMTVPTG